MSIEANLRASFRDVKLEMISIKSEILRLAEGQKELRDMIVELKTKNSSGKKKVVKKKSVKKKK